jgi:hypothetical protein
MQSVDVALWVEGGEEDANNKMDLDRQIDSLHLTMKRFLSEPACSSESSTFVQIGERLGSISLATKGPETRISGSALPKTIFQKKNRF